jgi:hypothetical protein
MTVLRGLPSLPIVIDYTIDAWTSSHAESHGFSSSTLGACISDRVSWVRCGLDEVLRDDEPTFSCTGEPRD